MLTELRLRNQSQQLYVRALSAAWRRSTQVFNPSLWLLKDPEAEEKMLRDADIAHAIGLRRAMIAGKDWTLVPRSKNHERAEMALHVGTELVGCLKKFTESRRLLARAFFSGQRYARIHGEHRKLKIGDGRERVWYVPTRLEDVDMRMYRQVVDSDGSTGDPPSGHWERWDVYRGDWEPETIAESRQTIRHTYEDDQATLGHGRALREALGYWWYAKTHILQESLQAAERFGQGVLRARVDGARDADTDLPNTEVIREWVEALEDMRSRHVLVHDAKDDVDMVQMSGTGWQMFRELREELRNTISTLVLGATMNTTATQGGSYALAEVHENTTEALIQYDRQSLEETLTDDLLIGCLWHRNHANLRELGIDNQAPRFTITQEKALDPQIRVQVAATAVQMGLPLAKADVYEQIGFRAPEDGEDVVEPQQPAPGGMPGGGGFPFKFRRGGEVAEVPPWTFAGEWDESKHDRDESGKFEPKGSGGEAAPDDPAPKEKKPRKSRKKPKGLAAGEPITLPPSFKPSSARVDEEYATTLGEGVPAPDLYNRASRAVASGEFYTSEKAVVPVWPDLALPFLPEGWDDAKQINAADVEDMTNAVLDYARDNFGDDYAAFVEKRGQGVRDRKEAPKKWIEHAAFTVVANHVRGQIERKTDEGQRDAYNANLGRGYRMHQRPTASYRVLSSIDDAMKSKLQRDDYQAFAQDWDESKHPRDGGKFAPAEGRTNSGQEPDEDRTDSGRIPDGPTANAPLPDGVTDQASALARADVELASLPQDARDYIDGKAPMDRQDVTPAEKEQANAAVGDLGDAIAGAADAPDGTVGAVLRESMEDTADPSVKKINGQAMLKLAVGLGIMPAAAAWNVAKSYAGLVGTVLNLPGAVKGAAGAIRTVWAQRGQGSWSDMASSLAGKAREAASAAAKSIRDNPVTGSLDVVGTSLIAIPFPFSMDAGLAVKGIAKAGKAFNPAHTEQSIRESIRKAFLRRQRRDAQGRFASAQPTLFDQ